jgi:hypothetical protein
LDTSLNLTTGGEAEWLSQRDMAFFDGDAAEELVEQVLALSLPKGIGPNG